MIEFPNVYSERGHFYSNAGSPIKDVLKAKIDPKTGLRKVVKVGTKRLDEFINSFANQVDINLIMERYAKGDLYALQQRDAMYTDLTEFNFESIFDAKNKYNEFEQKFKKLPSKIKEKFGNDVNQYIASIGSEKWSNIMTGKDEVVIKEESKKEESSEVKENV